MRAVPRFGHSSDFSQLFSNNQEDVTDYAMGLLFIGAFVCGIFLVWLILLSVFKCLPSFGFLAGRQFTNVPRAQRVRIVFGTSATLWIVFTILLVTEGITNLQDTVTTISNTNQEISSIAVEADRIAASLQDVGVLSRGIRDTLVQNLGNFCPDNTNLEELTGVNVEQEAQGAVELLEILDDFVTTDLKEVQDGVENAHDVTKQVDNGIDTIAISDWQSLIILIPWILVPSFLLVGVLMAWCSVSNDIYDCLLQWFFLPLLVIMTIASFVLASVISVAAVGNADFCSGGTDQSPDQTVFNILAAQGYDPNDMLIRAVTFYINQCMETENDPFGFIATYLGQIDDAEVQVGDLDTTIAQVGASRLTMLCGRDFTEIAGLTSKMVFNLDVLQSNAGDTLDLLRCENLVPLYTSTVYDGTCTYSVRGITWTFSAFLVIACMGMFMIMFRSSYLGNVAEDVDDLFKGSATMGEPVGDYAQEEYGEDDQQQQQQGGVFYSSNTSANSSPYENEEDTEQASFAHADPSMEMSYAESYDQDYENTVNKSIANAPPAHQAY